MALSLSRALYVVDRVSSRGRKEEELVESEWSWLVAVVVLVQVVGLRGRPL